MILKLKLRCGAQVRAHSMSAVWTRGSRLAPGALAGTCIVAFSARPGFLPLDMPAAAWARPMSYVWLLSPGWAPD
jgi:hypothetical protein